MQKGLVNSAHGESSVKIQLFIYGTGAHARKVFHYARACGYEVVGFVYENAVALTPIPDMQVFHVDTLGAPAKGEAMFVAIGDSAIRMRLMNQMNSIGWELPVLVHPFAWVAPDAQLGAGALVAAGAVVETASVVGRGAIVDIGVMVDHDCNVGAFCHLKSGDILAPRTNVPSPV